MLFVIAGVLLAALKLLEVSPVVGWPWWGVLAPFAAAVAWWAFADKSGLTQRRAMDKMDEKKVARRRKALEALGLDHRAFDKEQKRVASFKASRQRLIDKVEGKREAKRTEQRESVLRSRFDSAHSSQQHDEDTKKTLDTNK